LSTGELESSLADPESIIKKKMVDHVDFADRGSAIFEFAFHKKKLQRKKCDSIVPTPNQEIGD
jgi:hypothetical protein